MPCLLCRVSVGTVCCGNGDDIPQPVHAVAGMLSTAGVQPELADWLDRIGPFEVANQSRVLPSGLQDVNARAIGGWCPCVVQTG